MIIAVMPRLDHQPAELQLREGEIAAGAQEHLDLAALFYSHQVLSLIKKAGNSSSCGLLAPTRFPPTVLNSRWKSPACALFVWL
jgi:hypothetical protein